MPYSSAYAPHPPPLSPRGRGEGCRRRGVGFLFRGFRPRLMILDPCGVRPGLLNLSALRARASAGTISDNYAPLRYDFAYR
jgi:hypothetical protein